MDNTQVQTARQIARDMVNPAPDGSEGLAVSNAQAILRLALNENYPLVFTLPSSSAKTGSFDLPEEHEQEGIIAEVVHSGIKIYPNPAKDIFILEYNLADSSDNVVFYLYDIIGKEVGNKELKNNPGKVSIALNHP